MSNSGLQECLETVYASTAVVHMMSGKAIQRAIRGHLLVVDALHVLLLETFTRYDLTDVNECNVMCMSQIAVGSLQTLDPKSESKKTSETTDTVIHEITTLYSELQKGTLTLEEIGRSETMMVLTSVFTEGRQNNIGKRTSDLWFQYLEMVSILLQFIRAERTGNC